MDYRPSSLWVGALIMAGLFAIGAKMTGGWLAWMFGIFAGVLGIYGGLGLLDWAIYHLLGSVAEGVNAVNQAKVAHTIALAGAIHDLSTRQLDLISSGQTAAIKILAGDTGPAYFIRGIRYDIPFYIISDYLEDTREDGYLFPIRDSMHEGYITDFTNSLVAKGWANPAIGNKPAQLTKPLDWVRRQYGMIE